MFGADSKLLTGRAAMGDWTGDAPGVRRKITIADLPPPNERQSANNRPQIVPGPMGRSYTYRVVSKLSKTRRIFAIHVFSSPRLTATFS